MAALGTVTVNVEVGDDLEDQIRAIVRDEVGIIAARGADRELLCEVDGCSAYAALLVLADATFPSVQV